MHAIAAVVCNNNRLGIKRRTAERSAGGITWLEDAHLCDLDFADDIAPTDDSWLGICMRKPAKQDCA